MMEAAKTVTAFGDEVKQFRNRWRGLGKPGGGAQARSSRTPLWEYYQPILQALVALGGEGLPKEIEARVEQLIGERLKEGDQVTNSVGHMQSGGDQIEPPTLEIDGISYAPQLLEAGQGMATVVAADVDDDGHPDLVVAGVRI